MKCKLIMMLNETNYSTIYINIDCCKVKMMNYCKHALVEMMISECLELINKCYKWLAHSYFI